MCSPQFGLQNYTTLELEEMSKIIQPKPIFLDIEKLRPREVLEFLLKAAQIIVEELGLEYRLPTFSFQEKFKLTKVQCVLVVVVTLFAIVFLSRVKKIRSGFKKRSGPARIYILCLVVVVEQSVNALKLHTKF